ncbi:MAG: hypothetical protein O7G87_15590 [bacterium]|nr:hypothetical protein [bacterium]
MNDSQHDFLIRCGRVFCADSGLNGPGAVAVRGDRIAASGPDVDVSARETLDYPDALLLPGLVDMHAHPARGGSRYGVDPDTHFLPRGVTTVLSQGDAGARNWPDYRDQVIQASSTRVRLAINLSAYGESQPDRCFQRLEDADVDICVAAIEEGGDAIWGIAVNTSSATCGDLDPREILARALEAAERTGCPLLFGSRMQSDCPLDQQLPLLRAGDVMTYCFNAKDENLLQDERIANVVLEARERGVLFDIGHGMASFSFPVAEAAIGQGFLPDTISTDQYNRHVDSDPPHDLPRTMSKLIAAGMSETDALVRVSARPAQYLGLAGEIGTLAPGTCADLSVLRWNDQAPPLQDVDGIERPGGCFEPVLTVRAGKVV